jgi:hypothetical protein
MKIEKRNLYEMLKRAMSYEILGTIEIFDAGPCAGIAIPYDDESYKEFLSDNSAEETCLGLKFMMVVRQFIENPANDICIVPTQWPCTSLIPPEDYNTYIKINCIEYALDEDQADEYHRLIRETNAIKAGQYLVQVLSIPLVTAVAFAKNNRYLPYRGLK